jgi:tetratricopeptide (TPR) repeat protein
LPLLILYDWAFVGPDLRTAIKTRWKVHLGVWATLSLPIALFFVSPPWPSQGFGLPDLSPLDYARSQLGVVAHYLRLAAWPNPLSVDYYDWPVARSLREVAAGACVTGTLIGATVVLLAKRPQIGFLGVWFFAILAPTSSILPLQHELLAERRMYLPLAAIVFAIVLGADTLVRSVRAKAVATSLVVAVLACVTANRNGDYLTAVNLYEHEVRARPNNARALSWYAYHLASVGKLDEALREANRGLEIDPGVYRAFHVAGSIALKLGNGPLAVRYLSVALAQNPRALDVRDNMAAAFDLVGDIPMAIAMLRGSLAIAPSSAKHYQHLAWYLATDPTVRDGAQALDLAERAASLAGPARTVRYDETLAAANGAAGRFDQAEALARQAAARARAEQIPEAARRLEEAIVAYRSRQPYTIERPQRPPPL